MILATQIIEKKREGLENSPEELQALLQGFVKGDIKDYQMASWLMAVCCRGLSRRELSEWTRLMWHSGITFPREKKNEFWIDKHSTGGVGDKTSLILVPLVTCVAQELLKKKTVKIPMVSGRGLGHSGGTLDKLESVKGFSPSLEVAQAMQLLSTQGFFMMGQTKELAPADRLLYSLRDVTGTVESIPLIVSSIMSKKLSENLNGIVFDVKVGEGAFMGTLREARQLSKELVHVAKAEGMKAVAVITSMNEPLGRMAGNFLEVKECAEFLQGIDVSPSLKTVTLTLAAHMLSIASTGSLSYANAYKACEAVLKTDGPYRIFKQMFETQGGNWSAYESQLKSFSSEVEEYSYVSPRNGFVSAIHAKEVGHFLIDIGAGRKAKEDSIDPLVGVEIHRKVGDATRKGEKLLTVYHRRSFSEGELKTRLQTIVEVRQKKIAHSKWILEKIS